MLKSQRLRWTVLLSALVATIAAVVMPEDEPKIAAVRPKRTQPSAVAVTEIPRHAHTDMQREWLAAEENPFAPRGWVAPPPVLSPMEARTVAPVVAAEAPPLPPPQLPFKFLGQMADGDDRIVYLGLGDQLVTARQGDVLDGRYKVVSIGATQMEFENTTSGLRQALSLPVQDK